MISEQLVILFPYGFRADFSYHVKPLKYLAFLSVNKKAKFFCMNFAVFNPKASS